MPDYSFADTHCHLDDPRFAADREAVLDRARAAGLAFAVNVGCDLATSEASVALAAAHAEVYATVGFHPHEAHLASAAALHTIAGLAAEPKVVAIGEIGLDYYYDHSPRPTQRTVFAGQLALAAELGLPVVIHCRDAFDDTFEIIEQARLPRRNRYVGVFHCFSGGIAQAERALDLGFALSFAGPVTYPAAHDLRAAAAWAPLDRLLVETDAPYLAPQPQRGRRNEPAFVTHTIEGIARVRGVDAATVATAMLANAASLFSIPPPASVGAAAQP